MWQFVNMKTQAGRLITPAPAKLLVVVVNTGAVSATVAIADSLTNTGTLIGTIDASAPNTFFYGVDVQSGIFVTIASGNADITVVYRQCVETRETDY